MTARSGRIGSSREVDKFFLVVAAPAAGNHPGVLIEGDDDDDGDDAHLQREKRNRWENYFDVSKDGEEGW